MATHAHRYEDHITPLGVYLGVGVTLLALTAITVAISRIHLGPWNAVVALAIASLKALLVALFFMHLLYDRKIYMVVISVALVMLGILIALTMADILRRGDIYDFQANPISPNAKIYDSKTGFPTNGHAHGSSQTPKNEVDTAAMSIEPDVRDTLDSDSSPGVIDRKAD
jgi:cytochrome c oxidase subunit 4